jgi:hypothetical protein
MGRSPSSFDLKEPVVGIGLLRPLNGLLIERITLLARRRQLWMRTTLCVISALSGATRTQFDGCLS